MARLAVITGFGGINAAGRSSGHHGYRRMVMDGLSEQKKQQTLINLAALTGQLRKENDKWLDPQGAEVNLDNYLQQLAPQLTQGSLIRELEQNLFNPQELLFHRKTT